MDKIISEGSGIIWESGKIILSTGRNDFEERRNHFAVNFFLLAL
jgi:hypothetical protein